MVSVPRMTNKMIDMELWFDFEWATETLVAIELNVEKNARKVFLLFFSLSAFGVQTNRF